ncbi:hypothetical protein KSS87_022699, partial [Heliosperma pusillum]
VDFKVLDDAWIYGWWKAWWLWVDGQRLWYVICDCGGRRWPVVVIGGGECGSRCSSSGRSSGDRPDCCCLRQCYLPGRGYSMDMSTLSSDGVVLRSFLLETVTSATLQSLTFIIAVLESLPSAATMLPQEPSSFNWLSIANSKKMEEPDSQCKDADGDEDDDDDDEDEAGGEAGDL